MIPAFRNHDVPQGWGDCVHGSHFRVYSANPKALASYERGIIEIERLRRKADIESDMARLALAYVAERAAARLRKTDKLKDWIVVFHCAQMLERLKASDE